MTLDDLGPRIIIMGPSNSGKSTLAQSIARARGLPAVHLDRLHHLPDTDWVPRPAAAFAALDDDTDARTQRWRVSLHDNTGWAAMAAGRPRDALASFLAARADAERWGTAQQIEWADEALAECRAALGEEA